MADLRRCPECEKERELFWVNDRYGIPYRKVCAKCTAKVQRQINRFKFDPSYAGERLEEDY